MLKKILARSLGGTALAGLVLTAAPIASTQIAQVACDYPSPTATTTTLGLSKNIRQYGHKVTARATVSSGAGTPNGTVDILINGTKKRTITLSGGTGTTTLPRGLKANKTHDITANYISECPYGESTATKKLTVVKSKTKTKALVINKKSAKVKGTVKSSKGGFAIVKGGKFRLTIVKASNGKKLRTKIVGNHRGFAGANFKDLKKGKYVLKVKYLGNKNYKPSKAKKKFKV